MRVMKLFERIGYLRAASELSRLGYVELAEKLKQQAKDLE